MDTEREELGAPAAQCEALAAELTAAQAEAARLEQALEEARAAGRRVLRRSALRSVALAIAVLAPIVALMIFACAQPPHAVSDAPSRPALHVTRKAWVHRSSLESIPFGTDCRLAVERAAGAEACAATLRCPPDDRVVYAGRGTCPGRERDDDARYLDTDLGDDSPGLVVGYGTAVLWRSSGRASLWLNR